MNRQPYPTDLKDSEWNVIKELMPTTKPIGRPRKHSYREIVNGIVYALSNGIKWRAMPHDLPPWRTVYHYFRRWCREGRWQAWNQHLRARLRTRLGRHAAPSAAIMDSQSAKTAEGGEARGYDVNKRCGGRKRHILVDTLGLLLMVVVTGAGVQDRDGAKQLLRRFYLAFFSSYRLKHIWADGGYAGALVAWVGGACDWVLDIVKRNTQASGFEVLPKRWIVERTFAWLSRNRRLSRDYERKPETAEAFVYVAMIRLMTRRLAKL